MTKWQPLLFPSPSSSRFLSVLCLMSHVPVLCYCNSTTHEYHTIVFLSLSVILLYTLLVVTLGYVIREPRNFVVSDRQLSILLTHCCTLSLCLSPHSRDHFSFSRAGHESTRPLITTAALCRCVVPRQYAISCLRIRPHPRPTVPLRCCVFILFTNCESFLILNLSSFSTFSLLIWSLSSWNSTGIACSVMLVAASGFVVRRAICPASAVALNLRRL